MTGLYLILAGLLLLLGVVGYMLITHLMRNLNPIDDDGEEVEDELEPQNYVMDEPVIEPVQQMVVDPVSGYQLQDNGFDLMLPVPDTQLACTVRVNYSTKSAVESRGLRNNAADLRSLQGSNVQCLLVEGDVSVLVTGDDIYQTLFGDNDFNEQLDRIEALLNGNDILEDEPAAQPEPEAVMNTMFAGSDLLPAPAVDELVLPDQLIADPELLEDEVADEASAEAEIEEVFVPAPISLEEDAALAAALEEIGEKRDVVEKTRALALAIAEMPAAAHVVQADVPEDATSEIGTEVEEPEAAAVELASDSASETDEPQGVRPGDLTWETPTPPPVPAGFNPNLPFMPKD